MTRRILLIEDDAISQDIIRSLLLGQGYHVDVAADGFSGLERARAGHYDALLIDYHLPEMDGYALARLLRDEPARVTAPPVLIGLTADHSGLAARRGADAVFRAILSKPIKPQDLFDAIEQLCAAGSGTDMAAGAPAALPEEAQAATGLLWRRHGLPGRPKAFASPPASAEQAAALSLCFDLVSAPEAEIVLLLERHGINEAVRACRQEGRKPRPVIALSADHADICDTLFTVNDPASWTRLAALLGVSPPVVSVLPVSAPATPPAASAPAPIAIAAVQPAVLAPLDIALPVQPAPPVPASDLRPVVLQGICTPLAELRNRLDMLARAATEAPLRAFAASVAASLRDAGLVAEAVADFLRQPTLRDGEATVFDPAAMAQNAVAMIRDTHAEGPALACRIEADLPAQLRGDTHRISQVLLTMLDDAVGRAAGGTIVLQVGFAPRRDELTFRLSLEAGDAIFLAETTGVLAQLRAMRLATVSRLVALMGGRIGDAAAGELFSFSAPAVGEAVPLALEPSGAGARVLLVDPGAISGQILATLLSQAGHHICLVPDIEAALFASAGSAYDIALIDVAPAQQAPDQGLADMARFRQSAPAIPVVLLTPDWSPARRDAYAACGIAGRLAKPCSKDGLVRAIESFRIRPDLELREVAQVKERSAAVLDPTVHAALVEALGAASVARLINKLFGELDGLLDPQRLAADPGLSGRLNALSATAAMFGLAELAQRCAAFDSASAGQAGAACAAASSAIDVAKGALGERLLAA